MREHELVEFLLRVLVGNTLPFVDDGELMQGKARLATFAIGAAAYAAKRHGISPSEGDLREIVSGVLNELLPLDHLCWSKFTKSIDRSIREEARVYECGKLSMQDLERALTRFATEIQP